MKVVGDVEGSGYCRVVFQCCVEARNSPCGMADEWSGETPSHLQSSVLPGVKLSYVSHIK